LVLRLGSLLALGFGEAGADIIGHWLVERMGRVFLGGKVFVEGWKGEFWFNDVQERAWS